MTKYTLMLFQMAYPEQIKIEKSKVKSGIIDAKGSAESMIKFIKKELGV